MIKTKLMTAEEVERLPSDLRCELIDGVLIELSPPGAEHGGVAATTAIILGSHVNANGLGRVLTELGCTIRRNPDTVRAPDVAFIRTERIPATGLPKGYWQGAPDLVIEVVSPGDTRAEVQAKIREWVEAEAEVWVFSPATRAVEVVYSLTERYSLGPEDTLDGGDLVPGFSCPVKQLFA